MTTNNKTHKNIHDFKKYMLSFPLIPEDYISLSLFVYMTLNKSSN